jgi:hypothetical protein
MNAGVKRWFSCATILSGIAVADESRWIVDLNAESVTVRNAALGELPRRLLDPAAMVELLIASAPEPEIESRGRFVCEQTPALAPVLAAAARDERVAALARHWLEALLATEIARRAPLDRLIARSSRSRLFSAATVTGSRWPLAADVEFGRFLALLATHGQFERPVVLDPRVDASRVAPVTPLEALPSTAGGLLKRLLARRDLRVVDLGLLHLVTTEDVEESITVGRERGEERSQRRRIEFDSAKLLADRLVTRQAGDDTARFRLWRALGFAGAAGAALGFGGGDDAALRALAATARGASAEFVVAQLDGAERTLHFELLRALRDGPQLGGPQIDRALAERLGGRDRGASDSSLVGEWFRFVMDARAVPRDVAVDEFLVGAASADAPDAAPFVRQALTRLAVARLPHDPVAATVAIVELAPLADLAREARTASGCGETFLRVLVSRAAVLHAAGEESLAIELFSALRGAEGASRLGATLYEEIQAAQSAVDRGAIRWIDRDLLRP